MKISLNPFLQNGKDGVSQVEPSQTNPRAVFDNTKNPLFLVRPLSRSLMKINLITLLLGLGLSQVDASTYAQQVTLRRQKTNLEAILKDFEKQSGYTFFYKKADISSVKGVDIDVKNMPLNQALSSVLRNGNFTFEYFDKTIVIKKGRALEPIPTSRELPQNIKSVVEATLQQVVRGQVLDESGNPIKGASIREKSNPKRSVVSQEDGTFNMPITSLNEIIVISYLGYESREVKASLNRNQMVVRLKKEQNQMEEVLVSTGMFKKEDKSFTGASRTVTAEELKLFGNRNLITSLRNIDPSFNIIESNAFGSDPNRLPEIQIRGNSSIPNVNEIQNETNAQLNTPLIILDGFQSSLRALLDINENDVQSITILKDAAATAMYGSRGANGVVVITTKLPKLGTLRVSVGSNLNVENADLGGYTLLKSREKLELERLAGYYDNANAASDIPLKRYYNFILNEVNSGVETDWIALPLRTSYAWRNNIRLEGGHEQFRYSATAQNNNISGVMKGSERKTFNGSITLSYTYNNLVFRNYLNINNVKSTQSPYGTFSEYVNQNPYWRPYDENGNVNKLLGNPGNTDYSGFWSNLPTNPLYNANLNTYDKTNANTITNNTTIEWDIISSVKLRGQFGITKTVGQSDRFRPADHTAFANYTGGDEFRKGDYRYGVSNLFSYDGALNLDYNKVINNIHVITGGLNFNIRQNSESEYGFLAEGFTNPNLDFVSMALQYAKDGRPSGNESFNRALGFAGTMTYIYDNRYFADVVYRREGSSQFGANQRFAPFWSAGLGWNIHEEQFFRDNINVNRLKLRGSIGTTGSTNFNSYQALTTYGYYTADRYYSWNGAYLLGYGNADLKWQQGLKFNVGTDIELFNRYLLLNGDYYIETTKDLVSAVNTPASNGFSSYTANIGRLRNKGFDVRATVFLMKKPDGLVWTLTGGVLQNRNKVLETSQALKDAQKVIQDMGSTAGTMYIEGYSSNAIWVVPSLGIDPSTGKELYLGANGEPTYTWRGRDVVAVGNTDPKFWGNFSTMVRYKGFTLNTSFRYRLGAQQYNYTLVNRVESSNYKYNMDERVFFERWQKPGDNAPFKGITNTTPTYKTSRFVQDENTLVMQNLNLQYSFLRSAWLKKTRMENLTIAADVSEPMYLSTIRRERGTTYPFSRQFSFTINATF